MSTLLLDTLQWDIVLDASGNIAVAQPPYALAQDVASAIRTFTGEVYYNTTLGIPYFDQILGQLPPVTLLTQLIVKQALTVPGVVAARCVITSFDSRSVNGEVQFTDSTGVNHFVNF